MHQPAPGKPYIEPNITIKGQQLKVVEKFTYLCSNLFKSIIMDDKVNTRLAKASEILGQLNRNVWNQRGISEAIKIKVYRAVVLTTLWRRFSASHDKNTSQHQRFNSDFSSHHLHYLDAITASLGRSYCLCKRSPPPEETALQWTISEQALPRRLENALQRHTEGLHEIFRYHP